MSFSQDFIERVRDANNIVDILSEYTQLRRSGGRLMGLCPFPGHNEKTPSFSVSEDKQVYHCFGCKRSGQIFKALEELKGLTFPEAVEFLANRAHIPLPKEAEKSQGDKEKKSRHDRLVKINALSADFFARNLLAQKNQSHAHAWAYCQKRKLSEEIIKLFQIGFAPDSWDGLVNFLKKAGLKSPDDAITLGLISPRREGEGYYDKFRGRLMFPIYSHKGECIGFGGRALQPEQTPKYLNSPESELFQKRQIFYGLNETAKYIRAEDQAIVVEGYMDLIALYKAGIKNVVATLGTALTPQHAKLIKRYTPNVLVLFDGDNAGQDAAERSLPILLDEELMPKAITLPDELDPDEFIEEKGAATLKSLLASAPDLFSRVFDQLMLTYRGSASEKVGLMAKISPALMATRDDRLKDLYVQEVSRKLGVSPEWVFKSLQRGAATRQMTAPVAPKDAPQVKIDAKPKPVTPPQSESVKDKGGIVVVKGAPKSELFLLNLALLSEKQFIAIWDSEVVGQLPHPGVRELFLRAEGYYRQMPNEFAKLTAFLMSQCDSPELLAQHMGEPLSSMGDEEIQKLTSDCIRQVKEKYLRLQSKAILASMRTSEASGQAEKLEQIMNIQKNKMTLRRDRES